MDVQPLGSDDIYIADVQIGNPPQTLKIAIDTGSADMWVQSTDTDYHTNTEGPWAPQYKPDASNTSRRMDDAEWAVEYSKPACVFVVPFPDKPLTDLVP